MSSAEKPKIMKRQPEVNIVALSFQPVVSQFL